MGVKAAAGDGGDPITRDPHDPRGRMHGPQPDVPGVDEWHLFLAMVGIGAGFALGILLGFASATGVWRWIDGL